MLYGVASRPVHGALALTRALSWTGSSDNGPSARHAKHPGSEREGASPDLRGLRVLLVEDEFLPGILVQEELRSAGCVVLGPFTTLQSAIDASRVEEFDLGVLDINLKGQMVYPLADELARRDVPFLFLTGYASISIPERLQAAPRLSKPVSSIAFLKAIRRIVPPTG